MAGGSGTAPEGIAKARPPTPGIFAHSLTLAKTGVPGFDYVVDKIATLSVGQERALHRVYGDLFKVTDGEPKCFRRRREFLAHAGVTHQPVVRIQRYPEFFLIKNLERMVLQARRSARMHITDQTDFQRNSLVQNILSEVPQLHRFT